MYTDKITQTEAELEKVKTSLLEHQQLEQRLLGRLLTLRELQEEIPSGSDVADLANSHAES